MSNSKLSASQKIELREMIAGNPGVQLFSFPDCGVTVAVEFPFPGSKMAHFAISVASIDEQKFRAKVGKFHAMRKLFDGQFVQMVCYNSDEHMHEKALALAEIAAY
jgi:hypothetical protein